jgi:BolA protein
MVGPGPGDNWDCLGGHPNGNNMTVAERITRTLTEAFRPVDLKVVDESHLHKGHAGHRPGGESHFRVTIVAEAFRGRNRVETHRMVNAALAKEFEAGLHALAIIAKAPS